MLGYALRACSVLHSRFIITFTGDFPELGSELNDPYLRQGSKQCLKWFLKRLHDRTCPAAKARSKKRSLCVVCLCLEWISEFVGKLLVKNHSYVEGTSRQLDEYALCECGTQVSTNKRDF